MLAGSAPRSTEIHGASSTIVGRKPRPPMSMMAVTAFEVGSIRVSQLDASQLGIQTASFPTAIPPQAVAVDGMRMDACTALLTGSIRTTVNAFGMSTQMLPRPLASQLGPLVPVGPT